MSKKVKNGFFFFMMDFKSREEELGRKFSGGFKQIQQDDKCTKEWAALSAEEKKKYKDRAQQDKVFQQGKPKLLTSVGESIDSIRNQQISKLNYEENMKQYIDNIIERAYLLNAVDTVSFYFIHVNYFYTKTALDSTVDYIPAEFAVCEFSIKNGASRLYHQIIKAQIELGYAREAAEVSDATHKLNYDLLEGEEDYKIMCYKLIHFLKREITPSDKLPPLYTTDKSRTIVPCLLKRMTTAAGISADTFSLYSLEYLFGNYMKHLNSAFPTTATPSVLAEVQLTNGGITFAWAPNIECPYHLAIEGTKPYCSQAILHQWIFTFCDYCCPKLNVIMRPGIHCPENEKDHEFSALSDRLQYLSLTEKASTYKSDTEVSRDHQERVSSYSTIEKDTDSTFIDHDKVMKTDISCIDDSYKSTKPMRRPRYLIEIIDDQKYTSTDSPSTSGIKNRNN